MSAEHNGQQEVFEQLGHMTRTLHKTLQDLGDEGGLERSAEALPDTRQRLAYVLSMTEQAVSRVLNAVDAMTPLQEASQEQAAGLLSDWAQAADKRRDSAAYRDTLARTLDYLQAQQQRSAETRALLTEVVMAQEFQDLTGQVIKKVVELAGTMESQLLGLLDKTTPAGYVRPAEDPLLNGPAMHSDLAGQHALGSQQEVDKFLEDLGF